MNQLPDFMVVGGVKCGTTSLYYYLKCHPEVCVPCKESYLFTPRLNNGIQSYTKVYSEEEYRQLFARAASESTITGGEVSSIYLYLHEEVIPEIKRILGDIKIIMILRNPVDRAFSHYSFFARDSRECRSFSEAVEEEVHGESELQCNPAWRYVDMGFYSNQVKAYLDNFSRVKVVLFDDFVRNQSETMSDIYGFLGVDPEKGCPKGGIYNASGMPKIKWVQNLLFKPTPFKMSLKKFIVDHLVSEEVFARCMEVVRSRNLKKVSMPLSTRSALLDLYRADIEVLQTILERDMSAWCEPISIKK